MARYATTVNLTVNDKEGYLRGQSGPDGTGQLPFRPVPR